MSGNFGFQDQIDFISIHQPVRQCLEQKMKFSIKDFSSKCDQILSFLLSFLRIWSHLLERSLMENFIFRAVCLGRIVHLVVGEISYNRCVYFYS